MVKTSDSAPIGPEAGRKAAYFARNRAALISATQILLGETGWQATIDEVAEHAGVSVSTVYKHFETKELLFETCITEAWNEWEIWAFSLVAESKDPLEQLVLPMRLMVRTYKTHPVFAKMYAMNLGQVAELVPQFTKNLGLHLHQLAKSGVISIDNAEIRISNMKAILLRAFQEHVKNPKGKVSDADLAIELGLPLLGIAAAKAKKLMELPLPI
jgi:AcrR family transcriptional regulator